MVGGPDGAVDLQVTSTKKDTLIDYQHPMLGSRPDGVDPILRDPPVQGHPPQPLTHEASTLASAHPHGYNSRGTPHGSSSKAMMPEENKKSPVITLSQDELAFTENAFQQQQQQKQEQPTSIQGVLSSAENPLRSHASTHTVAVGAVSTILYVLMM